jgi:hypothetical protein
MKYQLEVRDTDSEVLAHSVAAVAERVAVFVEEKS